MAGRGGLRVYPPRSAVSDHVNVHVPRQAQHLLDEAPIQEVTQTGFWTAPEEHLGDPDLTRMVHDCVRDVRSLYHVYGHPQQSRQFQVFFGDR